MKGLAPQQHIHAYQQAVHTPPLQNTCAVVFPQGIYGAPLHFDAPSAGIISPHGGDDHNYGLPQASTNPPLPEPGYFTKPLVAPTSLKPAESSVSAAQDKLGSAFAKKEGQWECNISLVRNEPTAPKCVTCQNTSKTNSAVSLQEFSFKLDGKTPACTSQNPADAEAKPERKDVSFQCGCLQVDLNMAYRSPLQIQLRKMISPKSVQQT